MGILMGIFEGFIYLIALIGWVLFLYALWRNDPYK